MNEYHCNAILHEMDYCQMKGEYDQDSAYFALLADWHLSGLYQRRLKPLMVIASAYWKRESCILDAGCAAGAIAIELALRGAQHIDAVDFSELALSYARHTAEQFGVGDSIHFMQGVLEDLYTVADDTYDLIIAADVIEHLVAPDHFLREMWRVCKPGGRLIVETPNALYHQHPLYPVLKRMFARLGFSEGTILFKTDKDWNGYYHLQLFSWPELLALLRSLNWEVIEERSFGWWLQPGAADLAMTWVCRIGRWIKPSLRFYENTDMLFVVRKPSLRR